MEYEVIRSKRKTLGAETDGVRLIVRAPLYASDEEIESFVVRNEKRIITMTEKARAIAQEKKNVRRLSREEIAEMIESAAGVIPERVAHFALLVGVTYGRITIRRQRARWGSCTRKGNLSFNFLLMLTPPDVLDYVVVHELCHRKEMNHSDRFYAEVRRVLPSYKTQYRWLKENGYLIAAMLDEQNGQ